MIRDRFFFFTTSLCFVSGYFIDWRSELVSVCLFQTWTFLKYFLTVNFQIFLDRYFFKYFWPLVFKYFFAVIFQIFLDRYFFKYFLTVIWLKTFKLVRKYALTRRRKSHTLLFIFLHILYIFIRIEFYICSIQCALNFILCTPKKSD